MLRILLFPFKLVWFLITLPFRILWAIISRPLLLIVIIALGAAAFIVINNNNQNRNNPPSVYYDPNAPNISEDEAIGIIKANYYQLTLPHEEQYQDANFVPCTSNNDFGCTAGVDGIYRHWVYEWKTEMVPGCPSMPEGGTWTTYFYSDTRQWYLRYQGAGFYGEWYLNDNTNEINTVSIPCST